MLPITFGPYRLLERIAVGGMAEVFLAVKTGAEGFEKRLAIKRIRKHLSGEEAFVQMFLHEARLAARLAHPHIVHIHDLGEVGGTYFIAMEHVDGRDMSRVVPQAEKQGIRFPIEYAMYIAACCLEALDHAHRLTDDQGRALQVVHRDMTPENIMLSWTGDVKLLDFGIAKAASQTDHTRAGEIKGKLAYMSPEQARGRPLDGRSDLFTLGVTLYEWITGCRLFTGENDVAILRAIVDSRIYPPSYFREEVPAEVEDILMRALAKSPDDRFESAEAMLFAIRQWMQLANFTPTPTHLCNFLKQIFADERDALLTDAPQAAEALVPVVEAPTSGRVEPTPVVDIGRHERTVRVELSLDAWERLEAAATRAGLDVDAVVNELVEVHARLL